MRFEYMISNYFSLEAVTFDFSKYKDEFNE